MFHFSLLTVLVLAALTSLAHAGDAVPAPTDPPPPAAERSRSDYRLYGIGRQRLLLGPEGQRIVFDPVGVSLAANDRFVDATGRWQLEGARGEYVLTDPQGRRARPSIGRAGTAEHCPVDCDTANHPPGATFAAREGIPGARYLDLRPASCASYFTEFAPLARGARIEAALTRQGGMAGMTATVRSFPLIDWLDDEQLIVLHSRDLASESLDATRHPTALFDVLLSDGRSIERDIAQRLARDGHILVRDGVAETRVDALPPRRIVLTLLVRHGMATEQQRTQIRLAREQLRLRHDIELQVIEIP